MNQNVLLGAMLAAYVLPIAFVCSKCRGGSALSISSIITSQEPFFADAVMENEDSFKSAFQTRHFIAACMIVMAMFTMLYEYQRCVIASNWCWWSFIAILILLAGIFGVIFISEQDPVHYIFAGAAFFAIVGFMVGHTLNVCNGMTDALCILLYAQFFFMVVTIIRIMQDAPIFAIEALFILNFAIFYLYIHFRTPQCATANFSHIMVPE
jgi:hypothetical protein